MNIFPGYFDLNCQLMIMIAMLKVHSISLYHALCSIRMRSATGVHSFWTIFKHFGTLCSLVERGIRYREMLCAFSIAIIIINSQLKSKQPGNIFTPLGNLHDFFYFYERKKSPAFDYYFKVRKCLFSNSFFIDLKRVAYSFLVFIHTSFLLC